jgi:hypothetical protein
MNSKQPKSYTAIGEGSTIRIYDASNGSVVASRNMGFNIESCVGVGNRCTAVLVISPTKKHINVYEMPTFRTISSRPV